MSDLIQLVALAMAAGAIAQLGYMCGRRSKSKRGPEELMEIRPLPYVAFQPGSRVADKIVFLEGVIKVLKSAELVEVAGLENQAG